MDDRGAQAGHPSRAGLSLAAALPTGRYAEQAASQPQPAVAPRPQLEALELHARRVVRPVGEHLERGLPPLGLRPRSTLTARHPGCAAAGSSPPARRSGAPAPTGGRSTSTTVHVAGADLGALPQRADQLLEPAQQRVRGRVAARATFDRRRGHCARGSDGRQSVAGSAPWRSRRAAGSSHCIGVRIASRPGRSRFSPMPISSPYRSTGVPGMRELQGVGQLDPPPVAAQHRRQPAPDPAAVDAHRLACGANAAKTSARCSSVSRLRSSSSWLRRKVAHCAMAGSRGQRGQRRRPAARRPARASASQSWALSVEGEQHVRPVVRAARRGRAVLRELPRRRRWPRTAARRHRVRHCTSCRQSSRMREVQRAGVDVRR